MKTFQNPILPGFYPDPSVCRVNEDYYLVTSSFSYYPGVPIFHSKDLVHWQQIGHVLDRPSQLPLDGLKHSEGIFAPTIRHHNGVFYMITTNVGKGGNFVVKATNPAGPWSDPYYLDAPGIDPSLFFDEDGKVYYTGTRPAPEGEKYFGNWEVWLQELDLKTMKLVGEARGLWRGALRDAVWPEGPHLYKVKDYYYLMISEAGTGHHHAVSIARSEDITGPYIGNPGNPILTHRHLGKDYPIVNVGHCDLVETQHGEWWSVGLASRPYGGYYRNLGRETFLFPVAWEDGWPVMSLGTGKLEMSYPVPDLPESKLPIPSACDHFDDDKLDLKWNFLRTPREEFYSLSERPGYLGLKLREERITELTNPSFVGRRQQHISFAASTYMQFTPNDENEAAGLVLIQSNQFNYSFVCTKKGSQHILQLIKCAAGEEEILIELAIDKPTTGLYLKIEADGQDISFYYGESPADYQALIKNVDGRILNTDMAGGFVGNEIGLYASSNGQSSDNVAYFDWFEYVGL